jgi:hypothetical protein
VNLFQLGVFVVVVEAAVEVEAVDDFQDGTLGSAGFVFSSVLADDVAAVVVVDVDGDDEVEELLYDAEEP